MLRYLLLLTTMLLLPPPAATAADIHFIVRPVTHSNLLPPPPPTELGPVITSPLTISAVANTAFSYQITAINSPIDFSATNLPTGFNFNTVTGTISGTVPNTPGTHTIAISARNDHGVDNRNLDITIIAAANYVGPGDIVDYDVWYGSRAYSRATLGHRLFRVCQSNLTLNIDIACDDIASDGNGDIETKQIGDITCPNVQGTCLIQTAYDQAGHGAPDLIQDTPNMRPQLMARAIPILGVERSCIWMLTQRDTNLASPTAVTGILTPAPITLSTFYVSAQAGRPWAGVPGVTAIRNVVLTSAPVWGQSPNRPVLNAIGPSWAGGQPANEIMLRGASGVTATANLLDGAPHAVQGNLTAAGTGSTLFIDGVATTVNAGADLAASGTIIIGGGSGAGRFAGVVCEAAAVKGSTAASFNSQINDNQVAYWTVVTNEPPALQDFTIDFDNMPVGAMGIEEMWEALAVPHPEVRAVGTGNYIVPGFPNSCARRMTRNNYPNPSNPHCVVPPIQGFHIIDDGPPHNKVLQQTQPTDYIGQESSQWGFLNMTFELEPANGHYNVYDLEFDQKLAPGFDMHSMGKDGWLPGYTVPGQPVWILMQNMWYAATPTTWTTRMLTGPPTEQEVAGCTGNTVGVWGHWRFQMALGPNGWFKSWQNGCLYSSNSRSPFTAMLNPTYFPGPGFNLQPHFGGQYFDRPRHDSMLLFDNVRVRVYNR